MQSSKLFFFLLTLLFVGTLVGSMPSTNVFEAERPPMAVATASMSVEYTASTASYDAASVSCNTDAECSSYCVNVLQCAGGVCMPYGCRCYRC